MTANLAAELLAIYPEYADEQSNHPHASDTRVDRSGYCSQPGFESGATVRTVQKQSRHAVTPSANPTDFCTGTNHLGEPCRARSLKGADRCFHHHPETIVRAHIHSSLAGAAPRRTTPPFANMDLSTPRGLRQANEALMREILLGVIPVHRANQAIKALQLAYNYR